MKVYLPFFLYLISIQAKSHEIVYLHYQPHQHGVAHISLNWINNSLEVNAVFTAYDVVNFEHIPNTATEKKIVRDAYQTFVNYPVIASQNCHPQSVDVKSSLFNEHQGDDSGFLNSVIGFFTKNSSWKNKPVAEHKDFKVNYIFLCDSPNKTLHFTSFSKFSHLKEIHLHAKDLNNNTYKVLHRAY